MQKYKETGTRGFLGEELRLQKLSKQGYPLDRLNKVIDWGVFGHILSKAENTEEKSNAGAKPYSPVLMFKILIYNTL